MVGYDWFLTFNSKKSCCDFEPYISSFKDLEYAIFVKHSAKIEGREHFHLLLVFSKRKSFDVIKKYFPFSEIHRIENSVIPFRNYCLKRFCCIDGPCEIGKFLDE
ncbi:MAG: hypothetical protein J6K39_03350 [Clostridia bacterium]|nr:hypothetical protein [Clostridia bacterium]